MFSLIFISNLDANALNPLAAEPWKQLFSLGWELFCAFALPMYIILVSTLITQIEFKNNTWKQVFASPQSLANIFFSKLATIQLMIFLSFLLFNVFILLLGVIVNLFYSKFPFLNNSIDPLMLLWVGFKTYISILSITAIQYCLSLRFKNFVVPVGSGLALLMGGLVGRNLNWEHIYKYPYAYPMFTSDLMNNASRPFLENHE